MFVFLGSWFVETIHSRNGTFVIIFRGTFGRIGPFKKKTKNLEIKGKTTTVLFQFSRL